MIIKCPQCKKESQWEKNSSRPFCCERCRLIDLGHWADGDYRLPDKNPLNESEQMLVEQELEKQIQESNND